MSVYKVTFQEKAPRINIDVPTMMKTLGGFKFVFDGTPREEIWKKFTASLFNNEEIATDLGEWQRNICFNLKAYNALHLNLDRYGEFLPIDLSGETWFIFNITHSIEADVTKSSKEIIDGKESSYVKEISFNPSPDDLIFKTSYDGFMGIYCQKGFIDLINGHSGLEFNEDLRAI
ncbi:hypothetical protein [Microbulbifer sp. JTAC008]|uniref:hypothetical protein n=1 Tax=unclassified Microbulbifer TaxID=2619833 RepID=UPI004039C32C